MGKVLDHIDDRLRKFIEAQHIFFVATAPTGSDGHVNVSPKGHADTFAVLDPTRVAYLDLTGSGTESQGPFAECALNVAGQEARTTQTAHSARGAGQPDDGPALRHFRPKY